MARINRLTNFLQDISEAIKNKTGDNSPIKLEQMQEKILTIKTDNSINGIEEEYENNGDYSIGEFVGLKDSSLFSLNGENKYGKIYGVIKEIEDNKVIVIKPRRENT